MKTGLKNYLLIISVPTAVFLLTWVILSARSEKAAQARNLAAGGAYSEAQQIYDRLGMKKESELCAALATEQSYRDAGKLLECGEYREARSAFEALDGYKDSENLMDACDYLYAEELKDSGDIFEALMIYSRLGAYPGCERRISEMNALMYGRAKDYCINLQFDEACRLYEYLGAYEKSEALLKRCRRIQSIMNDTGREKLFTGDKRFSNGYYPGVYLCSIGYLVVPEQADRDTRFFVYYPGGRNAEINIDFLYYYLMNPAPNTIALFLYKNGIYEDGDDMRGVNTRALELLDEAAAELGCFPHDITVCGSSLGAYPAMHSPIYSYEDFGIDVDCVLSLDAGGDWGEAGLLLRRNECLECAVRGTDFYLFESTWVGTDRPGIKLMADTGNSVTMVGCIFDEHTRITFDAMGMGVIDWALSGREEPCPLNIYIFNRLEPFVDYP